MQETSKDSWIMETSPFNWMGPALCFRQSVGGSFRWNESQGYISMQLYRLKRYSALLLSPFFSICFFSRNVSKGSKTPRLKTRFLLAPENKCRA